MIKRLTGYDFARHCEYTGSTLMRVVCPPVVQTMKMDVDGTFHGEVRKEASRVDRCELVRLHGSK